MRVLYRQSRQFADPSVFPGPKIRSCGGAGQCGVCWAMQGKWRQQVPPTVSSLSNVVSWGPGGTGHYIYIITISPPWHNEAPKLTETSTTPNLSGNDLGGVARGPAGRGSTQRHPKWFAHLLCQLRSSETMPSAYHLNEVFPRVHHCEFE